MTKLFPTWLARLCFSASGTHTDVRGKSFSIAPRSISLWTAATVYFLRPVQAAPANCEDFRKISKKNCENTRYLIYTKDYAKEGNVTYLSAYLAFLL